MIGSADVLFVLLALDLLGIGEAGAGILAAALGAGTMVGGALTFGLVGRGRLSVVAAVGSLVWGLAIAAVGLSASAVLAPVLVGVGGAGLAIVNIAGRTMLQRSIRDEVLSRVFGLQEGLAMGGLAAGSIIVPIVVAVGGLVNATVVVAILMPLIVAAAWRGLADIDRRSVVPMAQLALLRRTSVFRPLPAPQLEAVARRAIWLTVPSGTTVISEGAAGDRFYVAGVRVDAGRTRGPSPARPRDAGRRIRGDRAAARRAADGDGHRNDRVDPAGGRSRPLPRGGDRTSRMRSRRPNRPWPPGRCDAPPARSDGPRRRRR